MQIMEPAAEDAATIHRRLRDRAERALAWLALRAEGDGGVLGAVVELAERRTADGPAGQSLRVRCERGMPGDELPGELELQLDADGEGEVRSARVQLVVLGRRKALRQVIGRLPALPGSVLTVELARDPRQPKREPARLLVTVELPAGDAVEDLITRALGALDALADEAVSREGKGRGKK